MAYLLPLNSIRAGLRRYALAVNLFDVYGRFAVGEAIMTLSPEPAIKVSNLYVYPVKGCKGQAIETINITDTGFSMDRQWMIVTVPKMTNVYQLPLKRMALIEPHLPDRCWTEDWRDVPQTEAYLTLTAPDMQPIRVSLSKGYGKNIVECSLWEWKGLTQDEGDEVADWLSSFLDKKVRLVRYLGDDDAQVGAKRVVAERYMPSGYNIITTFSYGFQILLVSKDSAQNLYSRMGHELPDDRWRPNIVVEGVEPWIEDFWERLTIWNAKKGTSLHLASVRPCDRCKVTATDQMTLEQGEEPLRTLKRFRQGPHMGLASRAVFFGWYMLALEKGQLTVGDTVEVTKMRNKISDYGEEKPKVGGSGKFVGSPEWILSGMVVLLAAAVYVYLAMHHWSWQ